MKWLTQLGALVALAGALASCGDGSTNPSQLWIAPHGDELHVQLVPIEPHPF